MPNISSNNRLNEVLALDKLLSAVDYAVDELDRWRTNEFPDDGPDDWSMGSLQAVLSEAVIAWRKAHAANG